MSENRTILPPEVYIRNMFSAKAARDGGIVRRSIRDVERVMGRAAFLSEMERRGFTTVENAGQFVVFCNRERVRRVTGEFSENSQANFSEKFAPQATDAR